MAESELMPYQHQTVEASEAKLKIAVTTLRPNPFRRIEHYPLVPEKIEALVNSITSTSFWDNLLVRPAEDGEGYEIAYGHHRLEALKKAEIAEVDIPVRPLNDDDMVRIMAHENMQEWTSNAAIEQETVRAVVEGFAAGRLHLPAVKSIETGGRTRYAPNFKVEGAIPPRGGIAYTVETITEYLNWKPKKVEAALAALALIEQQLATPATFQGLSTKQAATLVTEVRYAHHELKKMGKAHLITNIEQRLSAGMKKASGLLDGSAIKYAVQEVSTNHARDTTQQMIDHQKTKYHHTTTFQESKEVPDINSFASQIATTLNYFPQPKMQQQLDSIIKFRKHLDNKNLKRLIEALQGVAKTMENYAKRLEKPTVKPAPKNVKLLKGPANVK
jgi:hypothetical protein